MRAPLTRQVPCGAGAGVVFHLVTIAGLGAGRSCPTRLRCKCLEGGGVERWGGLRRRGHEEATSNGNTALRDAAWRHIGWRPSGLTHRLDLRSDREGGLEEWTVGNARLPNSDDPWGFGGEGLGTGPAPPDGVTMMWHQSPYGEQRGKEARAKRQPLNLDMAEKLGPEKRHAFVHNGQKVFEWDQTLEEVNMYIELPKGVPTKLFNCTIQATHVEVGIRSNPPYLNHDLTHPVKTDSSFWTIEDGEMHITLQKREKGKTWSSPIQGQGSLDPCTADQEQKRLMLQRFQEENRGFDFSQAQFTGTCPDPRTFMGGIRSD
ncbi:hypothetical protein E2562_002070 [Oryza meyeriana var. granulata]|uniref:CS domain-containing protein n=1 Tax=Oryza meyeriana var. granulata TaxID=110450 RepID=A0A6G1EDE6_9ORYZ|nr:hypothetical protein E2562_002070 [Oryza meyeriana var. granulata]